MVENRDLNVLPCFTQLLSGVYVLVGRRGISGRVIMGDDYRSGALPDSRLENLTRVNDRAVERADEYGFDVFDLILGITQ